MARFRFPWRSAPDVSASGAESPWSYLESEWKVEGSREHVEVTSMHPTPNEHWTFTDAAGHEHRYDRGYPSLDRVIDESEEIEGYWERWGEGPFESTWIEGWTHVIAEHFECKECHEMIKPTMDPPGMVKHIPGMESWTLGGSRLSREVADVRLVETFEVVLDAGEMAGICEPSMVSSIPEDFADHLIGIVEAAESTDRFRVIDRTFSRH